MMESTSLTPDTNASIINVTGWKDLYLVVMHHIPLAMYIDKFTTPVCCVIGLVGNVISVRIWVMRRMRKCNSSASYLATLAMSDILFLVLVVPYELQYAWMVGSLQLQGWCQLWNVLYMSTQYFSLLLVCAFTLERFLSVCRPFDCQRFAKTSRSAKVIVGILCLSLVLAMPQGVFWTVNPVSSECQLRDSKLEIYHFWNLASETVMFGVLPVLALILNICVLRQIKTVGRLYVTEASSTMVMSRGGVGGGIVGGGGGGGGSKGGSGGSGGGTSNSGGGSTSRCATTTTMTLLWISLYLICTKLPVTIVFLMQTVVGLGAGMPLEAMARDPTWQRYLTYFTVRKVIEEVGISHHAANIFIYCLTSRQFRKHLRLLCWNCVSCSDDKDTPGGGKKRTAAPTKKNNKNAL